ncbi:MAG: MCE family protein [Proteobacteria bacterium]|nr:MCE family protein [Desulfobacteraceae bacterium]MBU2521338.1 MCE family protein [Pseudomonadota bacterium]MBU3979880.1 MCE family protein [Pseudomonadota bacterium]MBU4013512.1 MCE family protein [Pseudomonadota bacterium]MBU4068111.1 MCE family protein [Pseudomonadota bacterium]
MASIKTKFTVGLFVMIGFVIAMVTIMWLGKFHYLEESQYYIVYFDESVQGLDKDSPVKYRGVSIGRVENIVVAPDAALIKVILKIESSLKLEDHLEDMVAELKSVGITGIMFIELERKKDDEPDLSPETTFPSEYPVIATKPSNISQIIKGIDNVLNQINALDLQGITAEFKNTLDTINKTVADAQIEKISSDIKASLDKVELMLDVKKWNNVMESFIHASSSFNNFSVNADKTVGKIDSIVEENKKEFTEAISNFKHTMKDADILMGNGSELIKNADVKFSILQRQLFITLQNLEKASYNMNRLLDLISDQPSQIIFGEPLAEKNVEPIK